MIKTTETLEDLKRKFMNDKISPEKYKKEKERMEKEQQLEVATESAENSQSIDAIETDNVDEEHEEHKENIKIKGTDDVMNKKHKEDADETGESAAKSIAGGKRKSEKKKYVYECEGCGREYDAYEKAEKCEKTHDCCAHAKDRKKGFVNGIIYGLVPHTFCILFIIGSILGVTMFTSFFKPFLASRNFFYILIALSFSFATLSALFYLKRNNCLCLSGARKRWKFLSILYTTTIAINLLFFFVIFPSVANLSLGSVTASVISSGSGNSNPNSNYPSLTLDVDIPCSGHAPLIIGELKKIQGVIDVKYQSGKFNVFYDSSQTSKDSILSISIFKEYPAKVVSESPASAISPTPSSTPSTSTAKGGCCGGSGGCGGGCGGSGGGGCGL